MFFSFFKKRFKTLDDFLSAYDNVHQTVSILINEYNDSINNNEIFQSRDTDSTLVIGLHDTYLDMKDVALSIDNLILEYSTKNVNDFYKIYSNKLPKSTGIEFNEKMLENENFQISTFPEFVFESDISTYCGTMLKKINTYYKTVSKIEQIEKVIENAKEKGFSIKNFEKLLKLNIARKTEVELEISLEFLKTKHDLAKTLTFISDLPTEFKNKDSLGELLSIHAYFRKLIAEEFLSVNFKHKRFTDKKPEIISHYFNDLGFYFVEN